MTYNALFLSDCSGYILLFITRNRFLGRIKSVHWSSCAFDLDQTSFVFFRKCHHGEASTTEQILFCRSV